MTIVKIAAIVILASVLSMIVRQYKGEYALVIQLSGIILVILVALSTVDNLLNEVKNLISDTSVNIDFASVLIKILGISIIVEMSADVCSDTGNSALASNVELVGKIIILGMTFPMLKTLISFISGLLS